MLILNSISSQVLFRSITVCCVHLWTQNPELEARVQRLKAEQNEREYQKITSNVHCQVRPIRSFKTEYQDSFFAVEFSTYRPTHCEILRTLNMLYAVFLYMANDRQVLCFSYMINCCGHHWHTGLSFLDEYSAYTDFYNIPDIKDWMTKIWEQTFSVSSAETDSLFKWLSMVKQAHLWVITVSLSAGVIRCQRQFWSLTSYWSSTLMVAYDW